MAKERFLIIASPAIDDCFSRFSESENREAIAAGTADPDDAYSWIEKTFEIRLVRWREATHICSFTPSARYEFLANYFVGQSNEKWLDDGDPDGLETENGGESGGYGTYRDDYDPRFIVDEFTIDTMKHLDGLRKPRDNRSEAGERYLDAIWNLAIETAHEMSCNTDWGTAPILSTFAYRQWERECVERIRREACERSKRAGAFDQHALTAQ